MKRILHVAVAAVAGAAPLSAQSLTPDQIRRIDSVFARFDGTNRPGCSLGVGMNGAPVYLRGYGMSDLQHGVPITPQSIFHVASVSKEFTAYAVALLAEDGKLSLDDEARKYVPELPDYGKKITIRHLIYHTSGVRDQWELLGMAGWRYPDDLFTNQDVLDIVSRQKELNFDPGEQYLYSNSGYTLLAVIVQRVSGKTFREFADERIFRPLGMTSTHVHDDHAMIVPGRTSAYEGGPGKWKISIPDFDTHGATSLFTTPADLIKWEHNFTSGAVGSAALRRDALTSANLNSGKSANYAFGVVPFQYRGMQAYGHGGADAGYRADVIWFPGPGLDLAVECNFAEAEPGNYSRAVADILLEGKLEPKPAAAAGPAAGKAVSAARLEQLAGVYKAPAFDQVFVLTLKDGKLVLENFGLPLEPVDDSHFTVFGTPVTFVGPPAGVPVAVQVAVTGDSMVRMPAFKPNPAELAAYAGDYWSEELRVSYRVEVKDGALVFKPFKRDPVTLRPAFADAFVAGEAGTVRFVRTKGAVTGFRLTGGRVRNMAFEKGRNRP